MMKKGLGKGLGALIPDKDIFSAEEAPVGSIRQVATDKITASKEQPRRIFDDEKIQELAVSIKNHGVLQPLVLREVGDGYELVVGERRLRAARVAGLPEVPAIIMDVDDHLAAELALIENLQREDLAPLDEALAFRRMMQEYHYTQEALGEALGKSRSYVANSLRLLSLNEQEQEYLTSGEITPGHARALLSVKKEEGRVYLLHEILKRSLSVRQTEMLAHKINDTPVETKKEVPVPAESPAFHRQMEDKLRDMLGTKVKIKETEFGGKIEIDYYSEEDLERVLNMLIEEEKALSMDEPF